MDRCIMDLNGEEIIGTFYEKELQETNQTEFKIEKVIKRKEISYLLNEKVMITNLMDTLIKIMLYKMSQYFHKPSRIFGRDIYVKTDLSNYATEKELKKFKRS